MIEPFLARADQVLGTGYSAVLSGSAVRGDHLADRSDYNLLVVADRLDSAMLRDLGPAFAPFAQRGLRPPLVIARAEWARAADVFPIEIADMRTAYRVVRGTDPLAGLVVKHTDLRRALESELRGKLLQLRMAYALYHTDRERLAAVAGNTIGSIRVLLRATLVLDGKAVPPTDAGLVTAVAGLLSVAEGPLSELLQHRRQAGWRAEASLFEAYLGIVEAATRFIDHHHAGVH